METYFSSHDSINDMSMNKIQDVWVFVEHYNGEIEDEALGLLSETRYVSEKYGFNVSAVLLADNYNHDHIKELCECGAQRVIIARNSMFKELTTELQFHALTKLIDKYSPHVVLFNATRNGVDIAGRLAVKYKTCLLSHIIYLDFDKDKRLIGKVPGFGGNIAAIVKCEKGLPQLATVSLGVFKPRKFESKCEVVHEEVKLDKPKFIRIIQRVKRDTIDITRADKVVVVGRGAINNLELVRTFAELLKASIGASKPVVDLGLLPKNVMVGSSGVNLRSKFAIVLGVSGAPHFVAGIRNVEKVIAVNTDPNAPILEHSDYYIICDASEFLNLVIDRLKNRLQR